MRRVCLAALIVVACYGMSQQVQREKHPKPAGKCELTGVDYAVYSALIEGLGRPEDPEESWQGKEMLIEGSTTAPLILESKWGTWGFRSKSQAAPSKGTLADFELKSRSICPVGPNLAIPSSYKIVSREEIKKTFKKGGGGWEHFYDKYPQSAGFWGFSRPGYNSDRTEAVLYVSHSCGDLCGTGHLYFLTKENGTWEVKNRLMLWIS